MADDLRIDDLTMWLGKLFGRKDASAPARPIDPMSELAAQSLARLFEAHGLACGRHDEWVTPKGELPAMRAFWFPRETDGVLDIQVFVRQGSTIVESFAGLGQREDGVRSAVENFAGSSLHVMLSALWDHDDPARVTTERWNIASEPFTAVIGNLGMRGTDQVDAPAPPAGLFNALHQAICRESLPPELHWFRFYIGNARGDLTFESLRDNEPWPPGVDALKSLAWAPTDDSYGARLFLILKPAARAET